MGSSGSKAAKATSSATQNIARKYPTRPPINTRGNLNNRPPPEQRPASQEAVGPNVYPEPHAAEERTPVVNHDAQDPDLALNARLQSLGPVQPNPTQSNSSTFNFSRAGPVQHSRNKTPASQRQANASTPNHDPNMSSLRFVPSASNPQQSIFPTADQQGQENVRQNPAVSLLTARYRLAEEAEREFGQVGKAGAEGRQFLDVVTLRQVLTMRDEKGIGAAQIERQLGLKTGVVGRLGRPGLFGVGA